MGTRLDLHEILKDILGSANVYYQPPESVKIVYPCIVYERVTIDIKHASNKPYLHKKRYKVTLIDKNPDSLILDKLLSLPMCTFDRHFTADNLNHDSLNIYF